jgi:hypothetical protein
LGTNDIKSTQYYALSGFNIDLLFVKLHPDYSSLIYAIRYLRVKTGMNQKRGYVGKTIITL